MPPPTWDNPTSQGLYSWLWQLIVHAPTAYQVRRWYTFGFSNNRPGAINLWTFDVEPGARYCPWGGGIPGNGAIRCCHVMYKLLYPSIRVRTAPPVSVRVTVRVSVSFSYGVTLLRLLFLNLGPLFPGLPTFLTIMWCFGDSSFSTFGPDGPRKLATFIDL